VLREALDEMRREGLAILRTAPVAITRPIGPSLRRYANSAVLVEADEAPDELLLLLKSIEARFGQRRGQRWSARVLDCDIILWDGGAWGAKNLVVPHAHYRTRSFVLGPATAIAPVWRDPLSGLTTRQLHARLTRPRPAPSCTPSRLPKR
jgi:2-amino-4-hydroxy-6-hydroxymethyldihydropteridine diphosphokinase